MNSPAARNQAFAKRAWADFLPIGVDTITASTELTFDLYMEVDPTAAPVLYRERRLALAAGDISRLLESGTSTLYIRVADHTTYRDYLAETVLKNKSVSASRRLHILKIANRAVFQSALGNRNASKLVGFAAEYGSEMAEILSENGLQAGEVFGLMEHDYYTYTHATNVSVLSLLIARQLGFQEREELAAIATGAVLHDVGKRQIAPALLNEDKPLSEEQFETIREHPKLGFMELGQREDVTWDQLMMVYQHHEKWNGRGYPVGLIGEEIHPWARICSVADVYDAIASARPYRGALPHSKVWGILERGRNRDFDEEPVLALKSVVPA